MIHLNAEPHVKIHVHCALCGGQLKVYQKTAWSSDEKLDKLSISVLPCKNCRRPEDGQHKSSV